MTPEKSMAELVKESQEMGLYEQTIEEIKANVRTYIPDFDMATEIMSRLDTVSVFGTRLGTQNVLSIVSKKIDELEQKDALIRQIMEAVEEARECVGGDNPACNGMPCPEDVRGILTTALEEARKAGYE